MILLALLAGCNREAEEWSCVGPLVDLVRWRDEREVARLYRGEAIAPDALAAQEREHVEAAVAALTGKRGRCEMTWAMVMYQPIDNPGLRLREEALLRLLGQPPHTYDAQAVGWAGVTTTGERPVEKAKP